VKVSAALEKKILAASLQAPDSANPGLRGKRVFELRLVWPWPPTVDKLYVPVPMPKVAGKKQTARLILSAEGKAYYDECQAFCLTHGIKGHVEGRLVVQGRYFPPHKLRYDLNNRHKALLDSFKHCRLYEDDEQIDFEYWSRSPFDGVGRVEVILFEIEPEPEEV
jgi:Holliday junction resolvase RusA-like endonuclease